VRLLLDTHAFLWFITDDPQLSATAKALIADPNNEILVSPASYWETAIKVSIGKYPLSVPYRRSSRRASLATGSRSSPLNLDTRPF
jgi:PIN domain nuclease of toxin-antitoxin system